MELDHVIVFVDGPEEVENLFPGLSLDPGTHHVGQGTRTRRVRFAATHIEIVWIDDPDDEQRSSLVRAGARAPEDAPGRRSPTGGART